MATTDSQKEALEGAIRAAWAAVEASEMPERLVEAAFRESLRALLVVSFGYSASGPTSAADNGPRLNVRTSEPPSPEASNGPTEAAVLARVVEETGVSVDKLEQVLNVDDGVVKLIGQHSKYGSNTSEQARTVAQIVTVVRKVGMGLADTPFDVIKQACESKHCYDSKNFASKHLQGIDGFVVKGENKSRRLEARGSGITSFPGVVDRVLGIS